MPHHALQMADGSVAIMETLGDSTVKECLAKWPPAERAKVVSHKPVNVADIPKDRSFRGAWVLNGDKIEHDMAKARDIKREQLRAVRKPLMAELDIQQKRALMAGDTAKADAIEAKLQALRDVTTHPSIAAAATVEELKAVEPPAIRAKA